MFESIINYLNANVVLKNIILVLAIIIIPKLFLWIVENIILKLTIKTKTELDDLLVKKTSTPVYFLIIIIGFKLFFVVNNFFGKYFVVISKIFNTFLFMISAYIAINIFDIVVVNILRKILKKRQPTADNQLFTLFHRFSFVLFWFIALLLILSLWGIQIGPLLASLGVAGIAVAFALQTTLGNIFGGVSLVLDRNISVGDVIDVNSDGSKVGKVLDIGLRSTKIRTFDNEMLIIPSGQLATSTFINRAKPNLSQRVVIPFGVKYGSDVDKVKTLVMKEIKRIKELDRKEEVNIRFLEMADSALNFKAYFYIEDYKDKLVAIDKANTLIYNILNKNRIEIPFPQIDVHLKR